MRLATAFILLPIIVLDYAVAFDGHSVIQQAKEKLPKCAADCLEMAFTFPICDMSDIHCLSYDGIVEGILSRCVATSCTIKESLAAKNFTEYAFEHPVRDHSKRISNTAIIGGTMAFIAFFLRVAVRMPFLGGNWGNDDWVMVATMVLVLPLTILSHFLAQEGLGRDMWTVPFDSITRMMKYYYYDELLYLSSVALTKISILLFYLRVFPHRIFRHCVYATIVLCVCYIIGFVIAAAVQCYPIQYAWNWWHGEHAGKCINLHLEGWLSAAFNIALDLMVIALPIVPTYKLVMSPSRKVGILFMFTGGSVVTVISILRLNCLLQFANSQNITWDYTPLGYWSTLEVHIGIIVACLPGLRALQKRVFSRNDRFQRCHSVPPDHGYSVDVKENISLVSQSRLNRTRKASNGSKNSIPWPHHRKSSDNCFQLTEYAKWEGRPPKPEKNGGLLYLEQPINTVDNDRTLRGVNNTQIERGSVYTDDGTFHHFEDPKDITALPQAYEVKGSSGESTTSTRFPRINVRNEIKITVETISDAWNSRASITSAGNKGIAKESSRK